MWPPTKAETAALFDARSSSSDDSAMHRWLARFTADKLQAAPGSLILDAAAGTALATRALLDRDRSIRPIALDLSAGLVAAARAAVPNLTVIQADVERLPFAADVLDAVICVSAAVYFPSPEHAVAEFARVLRPGGILALQVWTAEGLASSRLLRQVAARHGVAIDDPNGRLGTAATLTQVLAASGFRQVEIVTGCGVNLGPTDTRRGNQSSAVTLVAQYHRKNDHPSRRTS